MNCILNPKMDFAAGGVDVVISDVVEGHIVDM